MNPTAQLYENEMILWKNWHYVAGVDEAGRGPLAGPLCVAAVMIDPDRPIPGLDDSKKVKESRREELFEIVMRQCLDKAVVLIPPPQIDRMNILQATMWGMREAVIQLQIRPHYCMVDGNRVPQDMPCMTRAVVKGDSLYASIAAASILAKVTRDRVMRRLHQKFPQYGFIRNKGYPTPEHLEALRKYGPCSHHRFSYAPVGQLTIPLENPTPASPEDARSGVPDP